jgi:hypothetical protein
MTCTNCGTENKPGRKFCASCGVALSVSCPTCGAENDPTDRFCGECGTPLAPGAPADERAAPVAERRLGSILFMDLVGFTAAGITRCGGRSRPARVTRRGSTVAGATAARSRVHR